jgi:fermentation-respiration switch protein FrsA (DUF1100 family)
MDARSYFHWLRDEKAIAENQIILFGESLGSGVATQMATEFRAHALILEAPYTTLPDVAKQTYFWLPVDALMKDRFDSINKIGQIKTPLFIMHGDQDKIIPISQAQTLFDAAAEPKIFFRERRSAHTTLFDYGAALHIDEFLSTIGSTTKE